MNEAIKIVKAKLNEALDKNDSKAVREACIVLKAMDKVFVDYSTEEYEIVKKGLEENLGEGKIVDELIEKGRSTDDAFEIYWSVKNRIENEKREELK